MSGIPATAGAESRRRGREKGEEEAEMSESFGEKTAAGHVAYAAAEISDSNGEMASIFAHILGHKISKLILFTAL